MPVPGLLAEDGADGRRLLGTLRHRRHCELRERRSNPALLLGYGLLRGACHRAALCADPLARNDGSNCPDFRRLLGRPRKQQQVAVGVFDNKVLRSPGFSSECLKERDAGGFEFEEQRLDLFGGFNDECGRQQLLAIP